MKFCSDLGSCYRGPATRSPPPSSSGAEITPSLPGSSGQERGRRRDLVRSKSSNARSWRPKLSAISEDADVVPAVAEVGKSSERKDDRPRKKSAKKGRSMGKSVSFNNGDEFVYRHSSLSMSMSAFSASPFMF